MLTIQFKTTEGGALSAPLPLNPALLIGGWLTDQAVNQARQAVERTAGPLPLDPNTNFPNFIVSEDGVTVYSE
jgi:hypothetical protein